MKFLGHYWDVKWSEEGFKTVIHLEEWITLFGFKLEFTKVNTYISQIGPFYVALDLKIPVLGDFKIIQTVTPIGPLFQQVQHTFFSPWYKPRILGTILLKVFCLQFERDVVIWNCKKYLKTPVLVKEEGNIPRFRRWYSQFYPKKLLQKNQKTNQDCNPIQTLEW